MRLVSFTVENYRSITNARKIPVADYTVLVGPNNEGKSNILRALALAMEVLVHVRSYAAQSEANVRSAHLYGLARVTYDRDRDFPLPLAAKPGGTSTVTLDLELTNDEVSKFYAEIGSQINNALPLKVTFGKNRSLSIAKKGKGQTHLNAKIGQIAAFVSKRVRLEYIPAIRTATSAAEVIGRLVDAALSSVETNPRFVAAVQQINAVQEPLVRELSLKVEQTVKTFLPSVKTLTLSLKTPRTRLARREVDITIDDGVPTSLDRKGDGVQSLVALAIMRHAAERAVSTEHSIIAIEEPESHLHPRAIHELRGIIKELSARNQLVLSTHSPLFVNMQAPTANIIVQDRKATPAKNVAQIREVLGVRISDNLTNAELVLLVEGEGDKTAIGPILRNVSPTLAAAFESGRVGIDSLGGGTNLSYKVGVYAGVACRVHCLLDDDKTGRAAFAKAEANNLLGAADANFTKCPGQAESELEDLYDKRVYADRVNRDFGVNVSLKTKGLPRAKWSDRMRRLFEIQGKNWNGAVEAALKRAVAEAVVANVQNGLHADKRGPILALAATLENKLSGSI